MVLEQVAVDIETTGFDVEDEVTVVGFGLSMGVRVFVQTDGRPPGDVTSEVDAATETVVNVSTHASEEQLLAAVKEFVAERLCGLDVLLVAYNGERWRGGFDLPFLRTRFCTIGGAGPFADGGYADGMAVVNDRVNTTGDGEEDRDLGGG